MGKHDHNGIKVVTEKFEGIHDFIDVIHRRPLTPSMNGANSSHKTDNNSWYATKSYEEAEKLLAYGWDKPAEEIKKEMKILDKIDSTMAMNKTQVRYNVVGSAPCVPRALLGIPQSMYEMYRNPQKQRTVCILYGISASCSESSETLKKNGIAVMKIVYRLEKLGFRVRLEVFESAYNDSGGLYGWRMPIKDYKQPLDILKMCFPVAHPSMLRRFSFRWLETFPNLPGGFSWGYGMPVHHSTKAKEAFEADLTHDEHVIYSNDCSACKWDIEKIMQRAGLDKTVARSSLHIKTLYE